MKKFLLLLFIFSNTKPMAQSSKPSLAGDWNLQGVMEVGSGFRFNTDHSFEFYFSYGALDRQAKGTWEQHGDSIILYNAKKPPQDFKLVQSKHTGSRQVTVKITAKNSMLLRNIYVGIKTPDTVYRDVSNQQGEVRFDKSKIEKLSLVHEFFPERYSVFDITDPEADYFEFTIEPWIADVAFDHVVLVFKDGVLTGTHPLLPQQEYTYTK
jgi:hypothetical protein